LFRISKTGPICSYNFRAAIKAVAAAQAGVDRQHGAAMEFLRKHFNGDYTLTRSYWVHLFLFQYAFLGATVVLLDWLAQTYPARYSSGAVIFFTVFGYVVWGWSVGGTWASANKHPGRGGSANWAAVVKVLIVLGGLKMLFATPDNIITVGDHWNVAGGAQLGPSISLQVDRDGKAIVLAGGINDGTAEALGSALDRAPAVTTVVLQSGGGWTREGKLIAATIAARGLGTRVDTECSSACTIAFLAGKVRTARQGAKLGFHAFSAIGGGTPIGRAVQKTYGEAGLADAFIAKIAATPAERMWYPDQNELFKHGVLTQPPGGDRPDAPGPQRSTLESQYRW
jgi:hypothetical protein